MYLAMTTSKIVYLLLTVLQLIVCGYLIKASTFYLIQTRFTISTSFPSCASCKQSFSAFESMQVQRLAKITNIDHVNFHKFISNKTEQVIFYIAYNLYVTIIRKSKK